MPSRNRDLHFICEDAPLKVVSQRATWMQEYSDGALTLPIAHGEGRYQCSDDTLKQLQDEDAIALSYGNNPNGSVADIAGITNASSSVLGLMHHPERACDPATGGMTAAACWKPCWADANPPDAADFRGVHNHHGPALAKGHGDPAGDTAETRARIRAVNPGTWWIQTPIYNGCANAVMNSSGIWRSPKLSPANGATSPEPTGNGSAT